MSKKTIVVTGCSTGFGRVTALYLAQIGWHVFATVRREEDRAILLAEAEAHNCKQHLVPLLCDITAPEQVTAIKQQVEECLSARESDQGGAVPRLDALLNNAGTSFGGPIELMDLDDIRTQMEVNCIAQIGMIQAFLPYLKAANGMIINVSSISGRISTPVTGVYAASKFALEAVSDALRIELAPFGVRVVVIEPASSPTAIWKTSLQRARTQLDAQREGPYRSLLTFAERYVTRSMSHGFPPQLFAEKVAQILLNRRPRARYAVPLFASLALFARYILPDAVWDYLIRRSLRW